MESLGEKIMLRIRITILGLFIFTLTAWAIGAESPKETKATDSIILEDTKLPEHAKRINIVLGGRLIEIKLPISTDIPPGKKIIIRYGFEEIEVNLSTGESITTKLRAKPEQK